nr:MAG: nonstructural protein [Microvirus sp.]
MLHKVFAIRDSKAEFFNQPFFQKTHGEAERNFKSLVKDDKSMIGKYPEDYDLYFIGEYDDQKGVLKSLETPQHIVKAIALNN